MTGDDRGPAPPEVHTWDPATGRCDRADCPEIYAACPARGMTQPYNASGWRQTNARHARPQAAHAPKAPRAAAKAPPPALAGPAELTLSPAPAGPPKRRRR